MYSFSKFHPEADGLRKLISIIKSLRSSDVRVAINARIREFLRNRNKPINEVFKELCFCILTANFSAEKAMRMQLEINDGFLLMPEHELAEKLKALGHRYPNSRARFIVEARKHIPRLEALLKAHINERLLREWLVSNVKGLGYKEASHFLRNIGFMNVAIIDRHILNILTEYKLIERPKTPSKLKYLEIERLLDNLARRVNLSLGELDMYLWFMRTGKVLK
ncbi:MAG: N-glycosylase/DNA lyase [Candidatus Bathyarchaeia archaeon]